MARLKYTLRQLNYFIATAEHESLTKAARHVHIAQPAIASAITKLETQFGVDLINRHHAHGITLTPAGKKILAEARKLVRHAEAFQHAAMALSEELSGELSIGSYAPLSPVFMPTLIKRFQEKYPKVEFTLSEGDQDQVIQQLRTGEIELALLYDISVPHDIAVFPILDGQPYALLSEKHPLAGKDCVSLHDLVDEAFVLLDFSSARQYFLGLFDEYNLKPNIVYRAPSLEVLRGLVGWNLGVSILVTRPPSDITYDHHPIVRRPISEKLKPSVVCVAHLDGLQATAAAKRFMEFCQSDAVADPVA